ncbi:flagellar basal body rod protein FlgC [Dyella sp.]|uniref:flagellar basal body rod protein FlgC n=1 Tax=Dyella sp. TaxID=1869338 RepID=UPI002FDAFC95
MSDSLFAIARSGLDVERMRMEVIAQNLANAGSAGSQKNSANAPMRLISGPQAPSFSTALAQGTSSAQTGFRGTQVYGIQPIDVPPRLVYEPANPAANSEGYVAYPGIDHAGEMTLLVQTLRTYEANVVMYNAARSMYMRALDLGGNA